MSEYLLETTQDGLISFAFYSPEDSIKMQKDIAAEIPFDLSEEINLQRGVSYELDSLKQRLEDKLPFLPSDKQTAVMEVYKGLVSRQSNSIFEHLRMRYEEQLPFNDDTKGQIFFFVEQYIMLKDWANLYLGICKSDGIRIKFNPKVHLLFNAGLIQLGRDFKWYSSKTLEPRTLTKILQEYCVMTKTPAGDLISKVSKLYKKSPFYESRNPTEK